MKSLYVKKIFQEKSPFQRMGFKIHVRTLNTVNFGAGKTLRAVKTGKVGVRNLNLRKISAEKSESKTKKKCES